MNGKALEWLVNDIEEDRYGSVRSLIIARNDVVVFEEYFEGYTRDELQPIYSVTKSVISALIGIAHEQEQIASLDEPMLNYFPEYPNIENMDSWKQSITIRHLLGMTAGFEWNELEIPYSAPANIFNNWEDADDLVKFVLDRPMANEPGTQVTYNSGVSHLLSAILTKATGQLASDYAAANLFGPLEITDWTWERENESVSMGGFGLQLRPLDLTKFGRLYLQQGYWDDVPVITDEWAAVSTDSLGIMSEWVNYGYQWWRYSSKTVETGLLDSMGIYFASGYGGKIVWVIPYYNMVINLMAANSDNYTLGEAMLWEYLLRMIES
ncbi:MAG: serine hydrolase [Candidatus Neomarinimicrobiota bacterium]